MSLFVEFYLIKKYSIEKKACPKNGKSVLHGGGFENICIAVCQNRRDSSINCRLCR